MCLRYAKPVASYSSLINNAARITNYLAKVQVTHQLELVQSLQLHWSFFPPHPSLPRLSREVAWCFSDSPPSSLLLVPKALPLWSSAVIPPVWAPGSKREWRWYRGNEWTLSTIPEAATAYFRYFCLQPTSQSWEMRSLFCPVRVQRNILWNTRKGTGSRLSLQSTLRASMGVWVQILSTHMKSPVCQRMSPVCGSSAVGVSLLDFIKMIYLHLK